MKSLSSEQKSYLFRSIRTVRDFPKPGILFYDITTLVGDREAFNFLLDHLAERYADYGLDYIVGIESRGFIFAAALAARLRVAFVPIRKPKKLPYITISQKYSLEYGFDQVEMHVDAFSGVQDAKVLLIDDLIATGGTARAALDLIAQTQAKCVEACFLLNLRELNDLGEFSRRTNVYCVLEAYFWKSYLKIYYKNTTNTPILCFLFGVF